MILKKDILAVERPAVGMWNANRFFFTAGVQSNISDGKVTPTSIRWRETNWYQWWESIPPSDIASGRAHIVHRTMVLRRPKRNVDAEVRRFLDIEK